MAASRRTTLLHAAVALALLGAGVASALQRRAGERARSEAERHRPIETSGYGYVSSSQCRSCHPTQYATWHDSYHRTMTTQATPEHVHGDFGDRDGAAAQRDGASFVDLRDGATHMRVSREGDRFYVEGFAPAAGENVADHPERSLGKRPLALVTGSHHMQVYWYETGDSRKLGQLPFAYLKTEQRWIPRRSAFLRPPHESRPDESGRWNTSCIACHSTHGRPRADAQGGLDTRVAELGIACEACHGPAYQHVRDNSSPLARYQAHFTRADEANIVNPRKLDHRRASEICSQCHGIWLFNDRRQERAWYERGFSYRPGADPTETMFLLQPSRRSSDPRVASVIARAPDYVLGQFWPDGMARVSGREFNGMADSPCYQRGELSCLSCHSMHRQPGDQRPVEQWTDDQLALGMDGDRACTQCHQELASSARASAHSHHAPDSPGSRCYNCHMPYTSFGLLKAIRTHQVTSPNAQASVDSGRPNACNLCHLDRSLGWSADQLARSWGVRAPAALDDDRRSVSAAVLGMLRGDAGERALWASALGWAPAQRAAGTGWMEPFLGILLDDPYDAVRSIAARSLRTLPGRRGFAYDSVPAPGTRAKVAPLLARARPAAAPPASVPLQPDGRPRQDVVARLLAQRDQRAIDLLE